jgi:hypothetical protein
MDISIGSYKVRFEVLLIILILFWVIFGHAICSCSTMSALEGFEAMSHMVGGTKTATTTTMGKKPQPSPSKASTSTMGKQSMTNMGKEGFTSNSNNGVFSDTQFAGADSPDWYMPPQDWSQQSLVYSPGQKPSKGVKSIWNRSKTQPPVKKGQLSFYDNILFKPECCALGSDASSSMGCACYTVENYNTVISRGGNNVPYSEY